MPGPALNLSLRKSLIDNGGPPGILVHKLMTPDDVKELFDMWVHLLLSPVNMGTDPEMTSSYTRINVCVTVWACEEGLTLGTLFQH